MISHAGHSVFQCHSQFFSIARWKTGRPWYATSLTKRHQWLSVGEVYSNDVLKAVQPMQWPSSQYYVRTVWMPAFSFVVYLRSSYAAGDGVRVLVQLLPRQSRSRNSQSTIIKQFVYEGWPCVVCQNGSMLKWPRYVADNLTWNL